MQLNIEQIKMWANHLKSLTTLSSGLIVSLVAVMELAINNPQCIFLAAIAMGLFMASIMGSVVSQMLLMNTKVISGEQLSESLKNFLGLCLFIANIGFLCAALSLTAFGVINVLK